MNSSLFARGVGAALLFGLFVSGCKFMDARKEIEKLDAACLYSGSVTTASAKPRPVVVILLRKVRQSRPPLSILFDSANSPACARVALHSYVEGRVGVFNPAPKCRRSRPDYCCGRISARKKLSRSAVGAVSLSVTLVPATAVGISVRCTQ